MRAALDAAGYTDTVILAYAAKYTSGLYGPFREAVQSSLVGDRATYQQDPANGTEALRELELDIDEGADIVMVKPAGPHLDVIAAAAAMSPVPVAAYQISGEYSQIEAAAQRGLDRPRPGDDGEPDRHPSRGRVDHPHLLRPRGRRPPLTPAPACQPPATAGVEDRAERGSRVRRRRLRAGDPHCARRIARLRCCGPTVPAIRAYRGPRSRSTTWPRAARGPTCTPRPWYGLAGTPARPSASHTCSSTALTRSSQAAVPRSLSSGHTGFSRAIARASATH